MLRLCTFVVLLSWLVGPVALGGNVAITEFINNPDGDDDFREWVELFNYGPAAVSLMGWTICDEDVNSETLGDITIPSGGYLILTDGKGVFETEWLAGVADDRVVEFSTGFTLGNSSDEIILQDAGDVVVWSLAYANDEDTGHATFLAVDDFTITSFGDKSNPGIVRDGNDNGLSGFLGYESNDETADVYAYESSAADPSDNGWGSPLLGGYTAIPEPSGLALFVLAGVAIIGRRRC